MTNIKAQNKIKKSARQWYAWILDSLNQVYKNPQEVNAIANHILAHYIDYKIKDYIVNRDLEVNPQIYKKMKKCLSELGKNMPLQYVLGQVEFAGCCLKINKEVLIPRIETEEMVLHLINKKKSQILRILDIGTGSGCIAIALSKAWPNVISTAVDISPKAIEIAKENAKMNGIHNISFYKLDILNSDLPKEKWDLIISNPPYIPKKESKTIAKRVLDYEPHEALFVPDRDPLIFYKSIGQHALKHLATSGILYTETHVKFAKEVAKNYQKQGFKNIKILSDFHGRPRWVHANL